LKLEYGEPLSNFAFNSNFRPYMMATPSATPATPGLKRIGDQMRSLTMDSPATPAAFRGFAPGTPASAGAGPTPGGSSKKVGSLMAAAAAVRTGEMLNARHIINRHLQALV
jgi:hypothetical protein